MSEAELTAHLKAWLDAVPESKVSARQAALCALEEINRSRQRLAQLERVTSSRDRVLRELGVQMKNATARFQALDVVEEINVIPLRLVRTGSCPSCGAAIGSSHARACPTRPAEQLQPEGA